MSNFIPWSTTSMVNTNMEVNETTVPVSAQLADKARNVNSPTWRDLGYRRVSVDVLPRWLGLLLETRASTGKH